MHVCSGKLQRILEALLADEAFRTYRSCIENIRDVLMTLWKHLSRSILAISECHPTHTLYIFFRRSTGLFYLS